MFLASEAGIGRVSVTSREKQSATLSSMPTISDDGTRIAFLVDGYRLTQTGGRRRHVFVRDAAAGTTTRVSEGFGGGRPDGGSGSAAVPPDGRFVMFHSHATNLTADRDRDDRAERCTCGTSPEGPRAPRPAPGDDNDDPDVFLPGPLWSTEEQGAP